VHRSKPISCNSCVICSHGSDFSQVEGTGSSGVMLVGEASGEHEQRDQLPFRPYAPAGSVLQRVIQRMGLSRDMFSITNCGRCRPRNNWLEGAPWEYSALNHCRPNLEAAIMQYHPRCIVALGGVALRELTGMSGDKLGVTYLAGYPLPLQRRSMLSLLEADTTMAEAKWMGTGEIPVLGNFHPAYLRRGKASHQGVFARILQRGINIASGKDRDYLWGIDPEDKDTYARLNYRTNPTLDEARTFASTIRGNQSLVVSYDLETSESTDLDEDAREGFADTFIRLIQFSIEEGTGIAFPWEGEFRSIARQILQSPNVKCGHNIWLFDSKVLRAVSEREGIDYTPRGVQHDTLQMFHHWQPDLPAHLQAAALFVQFPFPWKHLASGHIEFYACTDVDATLRLYNFLRVRLEAEGIWDDLSYQQVVGNVSSGVVHGQWSVLPESCLNPNATLNGAGHSAPPAQVSSIRGYIGQVAEVRPILAAMEDRGVPIDDEARQRLGAEFDAAQRELGEVLSKLAPEGCQRIHPKEGYKTVPPEVRRWLVGNNINPANLEPADTLFGGTLQLEHLYAIKWYDGKKCQHETPEYLCPVCKTEETEEGEWYTYQRRSFALTTAVDGGDGEPATKTEQVERWCRVYDFNPNSSQQLLLYMKAKKHPIPKDKHREDAEGNNPDTTNKKELVRLAKKVNDPFYLKVIEYREFSKMRGTYIEGYKPAADGCVHTTFTFDTGIGQLSSRSPNVQNAPKHGKLAEAIRGIVCARPGYVLTEWDFKSCHVLTLGFLAEDHTYIRCARIDMHSLMTGHYLKLWNIHTILCEGDEALIARCKWLKSNPEYKHIRDAKIKHAGLGIGNGLKYRGLYERYMEFFASERETKAILADYEGVFGKVFVWQRRVQKLAHEQQKLITQFGHIRRFYEVFRWDTKRNSWGHGDQAEEAIAYWLANIAFGHIREKLKQLAAAGLDRKYRLFNNVHDSFMFEVREEDLEEHQREVYPVLVAPSTVLKHPVIAPDGLVIGVEGSWGKRWNEMQEMKLPKLDTPQPTFAQEAIHA
jgi:uracil-DNA glycosylase family 4